MATRDPAQGKLGPNWEGPYRIIDNHRKGTCYIETLDGQRLHHPWNMEHRALEEILLVVDECGLSYRFLLLFMLKLDIERCIKSIRFFKLFYYY